MKTAFYCSKIRLFRHFKVSIGNKIFIYLIERYLKSRVQIFNPYESTIFGIGHVPSWYWTHILYGKEIFIHTLDFYHFSIFFLEKNTISKFYEEGNVSTGWRWIFLQLQKPFNQINEIFIPNRNHEVTKKKNLCKNLAFISLLSLA